MKKVFVSVVVLVFIGSCGNTTHKNNFDHDHSEIFDSISDTITDKHVVNDSVLGWIRIEQDISIKNYFPFMDKLVEKKLTLSKNRHNDEYSLIHGNPWIIDSLRSF